MSRGEATKGRYKFPYGDFRTVHRDGLIAAKERAAQQGYQVSRKLPMSCCKPWRSKQRKSPSAQKPVSRSRARKISSTLSLLTGL